MDDEKLHEDELPTIRAVPSATDDRSWTFGLSAIFLAAFGAVISYHGFSRLEWEFLLVGIVGLIAAVCFFVWPDVLRRRSQDISTFNENMHDLKSAMAIVIQSEKSMTGHVPPMEWLGKRGNREPRR